MAQVKREVADRTINLPGTMDMPGGPGPDYSSRTYGAKGRNAGAGREVCQMVGQIDQ